MSYRGNFCSRLQNSPYICVFKYVRAVTKRSGTRLKKESETVNELTGVWGSRLLRHALPISLLILRKKPTVLQSTSAVEKRKPEKKKACTGNAAPQYRRGQGFQFWGMCTKSGYGVTIQMRATEQFFPVVLFIMLYKSELFRLSFRICKCCFQLKLRWSSFT